MNTSDRDTQNAQSKARIVRERQLEILHNFASRQAQLTSLEDIVWNIAKTAIAELGFEDCVVYLLDEDGVTLRQVAAHGPKNPVDREIFNKITIEVGQGIVGHVAATGEVQCIRDARDDSRYIVDDDVRPSELAVPIMHEGRVIGVLDSEHRKVDFFTQEDVQLFTTIASLASTRIDAALALEKLRSTVRDLEHARAQLEDQATELTAARAQAEAASTAKSYFLANMSHEIRTPMTAIVGFAELLAEGRADLQQQILWRNQLTQNAHYLQKLIGNVLDVTAVEAGVTDVIADEIVLHYFLTDIVENFRPDADAKGLDLKIAVNGTLPSAIISDPIKVREIMDNLISNALKYTEEGGVNIAVSAHRVPEGAQILIAVTDTGIGIPATVLKDLFAPFSRVHDTKRLAGIQGTGLGLSLAQKLAGLIGGAVTATSEFGVGSVFSLKILAKLPANAQWREPNLLNPFSEQSWLSAESLEHSADRPTDLKFENEHILLCEDSEPIAALVTALLEREGAQVSHCSNGLDGVQCFQKLSDANSPPTLVIMDMQMPIMDGYEATRRIKAIRDTPPVIALTAFALTEDAARCLQAGCDFYMNKPIDTASFAADLKRLQAQFNARAQ